MKKSMSVTAIVGFAALVLGILPLVFAGMKVVSYNLLLTTVEVNGFDAAFGTEDTEANVMVMLAYLLPLAGGVLALLASLMGDGKKLFSILALAGFVAGAIMLFMIPQFMAWNLGNSITVEPKMLPGVIYAAIPAVLGGLSQVFLLAKAD